MVSLPTIMREWGRIGITGFGGPPTHIALLRKLCVDERGWLSGPEFEDGVAATNMLPGPASTQLAIFCAWRIRGRLGAVVGGICFIAPGLVVILGLSAVFLASHPPRWIEGAAAGAGAAVAAVAVHAFTTLVPTSWRRAGGDGAARFRWFSYLIGGATTAALAGAFLVLVLVACGLVEVVIRSDRRGMTTPGMTIFFPAIAPVVGGTAALLWVALKVGALSYGGGFVIVPLMQHDAVTTYHWMSATQFLNAVALGQITPGPVVQTVAVVGYAAGGLGGGLMAAVVAFAPSFVFVIGGAPHFDRLRGSPGVQAFLVGAGAAAVGAIAGASVPLGLALAHEWQLGVLGLASVWLLALRRSVVTTLIAAGLLGIVAVLAGAPA